MIARRHILAVLIIGAVAFAAEFGFKSWHSRSNARPTQAPVAPVPPPLALGKDRIAAALESSGQSPAKRLTTLLTLTQEANTSGDWRRLLDEAASVDSAERDAIIRQWIASDPDACWEHIRSGSYARLREWGTVAIKAWAAIDPESAMDAAKKLPRLNRDRDDFRWTVIRAGLEHYPIERMTTLFQEMGDVNSLNSNARLNRWVNRDPEAAVRMLTALPATVRKAGLRDAVVAWVKKDAAAALAWAKTDTSGNSQLVLSAYVDQQKSSGKITSKELLELALTTSNRKTRSIIANSAIFEIAKDDPLFAFEWSSQHLRSKYSGDIGGEIVREAMRSELFTADKMMEMVSDLPVSQTRGSAAKQIAYDQIYIDPARTVAWLDSLDPTSRETAYQSLSINFVGSPKAIEWLTTAPDHPFAEEVLEDLVDSLIENEATATSDEWLPDFPPDRAAYVRKRLETADPSS
ncbi:MAG: hypothetical protein R3F19_07115 [Verrucomicrobiales bacterium]